MTDTLAPAVSRTAAKRQLATLFPGVDKFTFQVFDDGPAKDKRKAKTIFGTFDECADKLIAANRAGCGVYVTVNRTIGKRRKAEDVDRVRYHFIEADEGAEPLEKIKADLQPVLVIESSPGHYHAYAAIDDDLAQDLAGFTARQKKLAAMFKAGKESHDLARVLRLAGFIHQKDASNPFRVRIIEDEPTAPTWSRDALDMLTAGVEAPKSDRTERSEIAAADEDAAAIDWAKHWLAIDAPIAISDTENPDSGKKGNSTTFVVMCEVRDKGVTEATCLDLALEHYNPRCEPEWDFDKLKEIVHDAYSYAQNTQGVKATVADFAGDPLKLTAADKEANVAGAAERKQRKGDGGLDVIIGSAIKIRRISWMWNGHLALGQHTIIAGIQGDGKSLAVYALAAAITTGGEWPGTKERAPLGSVILLSAEDTTEDVLGPRCIAAGCDMSRIHIVKAVRDPSGKGKRKFNLQADIAKLTALAKSIGDVKLISFDPISSYLGGEIDSHSNTELRNALDPVTAMAEATGAAVVSISHFKKATKGVSALASIMGSTAFTAAPRAAYVVLRDPEDDDKRLLLSVKSNLASKGAAYGVIFHIGAAMLKDPDGGVDIEVPFVVWDGDTDLKADQVMAASSISQSALKQDPPLLNDAVEFLRGELANGPRLVKEVEAEAKNAMITPSTLRRAKERLELVAIKKEQRDGHGPWFLHYPDEYSEAWEDFKADPTPEMVTKMAGDLLN